MPSPIPIFGATSIPGFNLARLFPKTTRPFAPPNSKSPWPTLNLEDPTWLKAFFRAQQPQLLIYCHAVCDVGKCEATPDWAREINVGHIRRLLDALPDATRLIYISSDHVFGDNGSYDENSTPCPISVYGQTRVEAEKLVLQHDGSLILRIGLAIGPSHNGRTGHLDWLAYRHQRDLPITIIKDEARSAVWANELAERVMHLAQSEETGLRHIAATRAVSRLELATYLAQHLNISPFFKIASRDQQPAPHLGRVELLTLYEGDLYQPLPSVIANAKGF
ncbi:MAG: SDR family oxidoreductase [Candidatus Latescibacterota bacterium]